jgi:ATP-binding cassette subfamily F protein uup
MAFLSQNNNLQELTIEESIFASDNETLKVLKPTLENPEDEEAYQKLLTEWINTMHGI